MAGHRSDVADTDSALITTPPDIETDTALSHRLATPRTTGITKLASAQWFYPKYSQPGNAILATNSNTLLHLCAV